MLIPVLTGNVLLHEVQAQRGERGVPTFLGANQENQATRSVPTFLANTNDKGVSSTTTTNTMGTTKDNAIHDWFVNKGNVDNGKTGTTTATYLTAQSRWTTQQKIVIFF
jgi:hypothetical protein